MSVAIVWFRKSLRLDDNPALMQACSSHPIRSVIPLYVFDPELFGESLEKLGSARVRFLLESLRDLARSLKEKHGQELVLARGKPEQVLLALARMQGAELSLLSSDYCSEPYGRSLTQRIGACFQKDFPDVQVRFAPATHTLLDIEETIAETNFKNPKNMKDVMRIFHSRLGTDDSGFPLVPEPLPEPTKMQPLPKGFAFLEHPETARFSGSGLPEFPLFSSRTEPMTVSPFKGGETEALIRLRRKVSQRTDFVNSFRKPKTCSTNEPTDPLEPSTTGLSPYLSVGCLSVRRFWKEVEACNRKSEHSLPPESLHGQLLFREMFYLLSRTVRNWDRDLDNPMCKPIRWGEKDESKLKAWADGQTGFPFIDAMMRQLNATGWMHHLGRHAVSCFLTRGQLWQHWQSGRDLFERNLIDSDWALNNANWLWLSGVAPFSMPYFRLYNPCPDSKSSLNVETKTARFIKRWIPELRDFPPKYAYEPHLAPESVQIDANCIIGTDYPHPIVDRKQAAKENLSKFKTSLAA